MLILWVEDVRLELIHRRLEFVLLHTLVWLCYQKRTVVTRKACHCRVFTRVIFSPVLRECVPWRVFWYLHALVQFTHLLCCLYGVFLPLGHSVVGRLVEKFVWISVLGYFDGLFVPLMRVNDFFLFLVSLHLVPACIYPGLYSIHIYLFFRPMRWCLVIFEISLSWNVHVIIVIEFFPCVGSIASLNRVADHLSIALLSDSVFNPNAVPIFRIKFCVVCCLKLGILRMHSLPLGHRVVHVSWGLLKRSSCIAISNLKSRASVPFMSS